jgi:signal peptidase I
MFANIAQHPKGFLHRAAKPVFMKPNNYVRVLIYCLGAFFIALLINQFVVRTAVVHGDSMAPTLRDDDIVLLWSLGYEPEPGDVTITNKENPLRENLAKRILSVGKSIEFDGAAYDVPPGWVFLVGDNKNLSVDSRTIGSLPQKALLGKVVARVFPAPRLFP